TPASLQSYPSPTRRSSDPEGPVAVAEPRHERRDHDRDHLRRERLVPEHLPGAETQEVEQPEVDDVRDGPDRAEAGQLGEALAPRSEEHTSELQSRENLVCR